MKNLIFNVISAAAFSTVLALAVSPALAEGLADAYQDKFHIGTAISPGSLFDKEVMQLVNAEFNSVTAETNMKLRHLAASQRTYDFNWSDRFVAQGLANKQFVVGHTLIWHRSLPAWFFQQPDGARPSRAQLLASMRQHIYTLVGRYRGQVNGWDVVNEAFNFDGAFRSSPWLDIIGEDYIEHAFAFAHQADPEAELYYNDYGLVNPQKQEAVVALIKRMQKKGIPVHAVGIQGHYSLSYPDLQTLDNTIARFAKLGVKVMISELDVSVLPFPGPEERGEDAEIDSKRAQQLDPYPEQLPDEVMSQFTQRYVDLFCVFLKHHAAISRVTFWGVSDARSWRNDWPLTDRTDYPLLFDRELKPKPVHQELIKLASSYQKVCPLTGNNKDE
ncbi:hypothetical protein WG68_02385 [Arsukibacterium ikkense]|uniref:Beta-xylanase n=1 Tax=Arsukibacterium ikkense TaxID=336831 RepID=A0A0M2V8R8_9GAMM|nr:endo-1,4-beta-xylanase [Arsukibacterium ikkense]KKO46814.1 hypothetical protein WG68_02385 [Arsukibacterium ikkense]